MRDPSNDVGACHEKNDPDAGAHRLDPGLVRRVRGRLPQAKCKMCQAFNKGGRCRLLLLGMGTSQQRGYVIMDNRCGMLLIPPEELYAGNH